MWIEELQARNMFAQAINNKWHLDIYEDGIYISCNEAWDHLHREWFIQNNTVTSEYKASTNFQSYTVLTFYNLTQVWRRYNRFALYITSQKQQHVVKIDKSMVSIFWIPMRVCMLVTNGTVVITCE